MSRHGTTSCSGRLHAGNHAGHAPLSDGHPAWRALGYEVDLYFLRLPSAETAIERVQRRVAARGHPIPKADQAQYQLNHLQASILKDHTVMPGEWHGGVVVVEAPEKGQNGAAEYTVTLQFDGEEHAFTVSQRR